MPAARRRLGGESVRTGDDPHLAAALLVFGLAAAEQVTLEDTAALSTAFPDLKPKAFAELATVTAHIEKTLKNAVAPAKINYLMLMMVDPHVHFHVIPRYEGGRGYQGIDVTDAGWPKVPALGEARALSPEEIEKLVGWLRGWWPTR